MDVQEPQPTQPALLKRLFQRVMMLGAPRRPETLPALVLSWRKARLAALLLVSLNIFLAILLYITSIWPLFQPRDLANSAVLQFLESPDYREHTQPIFERLERYNAAGIGDIRELPGEFYAIGRAHVGVDVRLHYRLVQRQPTWTELHRPNAQSAQTAESAQTAQSAQGAREAQDAQEARPRYRYEPEIHLGMAPGPLLTLLIIIAIMISAVVLLLKSSSKAQERFADQVLEDFFLGDEAASPGADEHRKTDVLLGQLARFHPFARQLGIRYGSRPPFDFKDEYDVQDALHAVLRLNYPDVRAEDFVSSYAGSNSRVDFRLPGTGVFIEVKMTRAGLKDKEVAEQLIIDIARYQAHQDCEHLICLVYDPAGWLNNPHGLKKDLEGRERNIKVSVVIPSSL